MNRSECVTHTENVIIRAHDMFGDAMLPLYDLKINFFQRGVAGGFARFMRSKAKGYISGISIDFNEILMQENSEDFINTIIHEISHHVTGLLFPFAKPHGSEFKSIMLLLGGDGKRCHSYKTDSVKQQVKKFLYRCPNGCETYQVSAHLHTKLQNHNTRRCCCKKCRSRVIFSHPVIE